eukprot:5859840-Pyramimonas_sp.AAC.1
MHLVESGEGVHMRLRNAARKQRCPDTAAVDSVEGPLKIQRGNPKGHMILVALFRVNEKMAIAEVAKPRTRLIARLFCSEYPR